MLCGIDVNACVLSGNLEGDAWSLRYFANELDMELFVTQ